MSVTLSKPIYGLNEVIFNYTSDTTNATYYIYVDGLFVKETLDKSYTLTTVTNGDLFRFEVYDEPTVVAPYFANYFNLNFYNKNESISRFKVYEKNGSTYNLTQELNTQAGIYYYEFNTKQYADGEVSEYKIVPIFDINNEEGLTFTFINEVITYPSNVGNTLVFDSSSGSINIQKYNIYDSETYTDYINDYDNEYNDTSEFFGE